MNLDNPKAFAPLVNEWVLASCVRRDDPSGAITRSQGQVQCAAIPGEHIVDVQAGYGKSTGQKLIVTVPTTYWPSGDEPRYGDTLDHPLHGQMTVQDMNHDGANYWSLTCIARPRNARR